MTPLSKWLTPSRLVSFAALLAVLAAGGGLAYTCTRPGMSVLPPGGAAEWIVFPSPANVQAQFVAPRTTVFTRSFPLPVEGVPEGVVARVRSLGDCELFVNDRPVALTPSVDDTRHVRQAEISNYLLPGLSKITVRVANASGPPALWLHASGSGWSMKTDGRFWDCTTAGSSSRYARAASDAVPVGAGNAVGGAERTLRSMARRWPTLLAFAGASAGALLAGWSAARRWAERGASPAADWLRPALVGVAALWIGLFINNRPSVRHPTGFDVRKHLDYVRYIQQHKALPLADQGWEMHQPPLFYLLSAGVLGAFDVVAGSPASVDLIRALNFVAAVATVALAAGCLRLALPGRAAAQAAGLAVAAFLPMSLYMAHYLTNDVLAGALATGAVYACLRVLTADVPAARWLVVTGALAGAAVLTKVTALPVAAVVFVGLAGTLVARRQLRLTTWVRVLGLPLLAAVLVSSWHFLRVWRHFGTPLVGSFDPQSGFSWWQDPGYVSVDYFLRFGRCLIEPFFSEFNGFADGIYSTLWGDGLWGGVARLQGRPPWDYDLMAVGYLLAVVPTVLVLTGVAIAVVRMVRAPAATWAVLLAISLATALAMLYHFLRLPYACHVKAFYGLPAVAALAAFAGLGFDVLTGRSRLVRAGAALALSLWAVTAYASYWIPAGAAATETWAGHQFLGQDRLADAEQHYRNALRADPNYAPAEAALGNLLAKAGRRDEAQEHFQRAIARDPDDTAARLGMAMTLVEDGQLDAAARHLRRILQLQPDSALALPRLGLVLLKQGRLADGTRVLREALTLTPADAQTHHLLAVAFGARDALPEALDHSRMALQWNPEFPVALNWRARVLATYPDARWRDGKEAVRLARLACAMTRNSDAAILDTLAAALAEAGNFDQAVRIQEAALRLAEAAAASGGQRPSAEGLRQRLHLYEAHQAYREKPKL